MEWNTLYDQNSILLNTVDEVFCVLFLTLGTKRGYAFN